MQRMKVVLPEPEAPMTTTTSCRSDLHRDALEDVQATEVLVDVGGLDDDSPAQAPARRRSRARSSCRPIAVISAPPLIESTISSAGFGARSPKIAIPEARRRRRA